MRRIIVIAHNMRSTHNVGSLLRTAEGLGIEAVYLTGYTPYPLQPGDTRLPHEAAKLHKQIQKTALGAETSQHWQQDEDVFRIISDVRNQGFKVIALEQAADAGTLPAMAVPENVALLLGREVEGIEQEVLAACDGSVEIPMFGSKESFNVVQAAAMALYHCRFYPFGL